MHISQSGETESRFILDEQRHILQVPPRSGFPSHAANINCGWSLPTPYQCKDAGVEKVPGYQIPIVVCKIAVVQPSNVPPS